MKKLSVLFLSACAMSVFVASNAGAVPTSPATTVSPVNTAAINRGGILSQFQSTVKGTIKVPVALATKIPGIECSNISIAAYSQEMKPAVPGGIFQTSKWTHYTTATGTWSSGVCSYSLNVVPNSSFALNFDGAMPATGGPKCYQLGIIATPQQVGYSKVALGAVKEQDFTVNDAGCQANPPG